MQMHNMVKKKKQHIYCDYFDRYSDYGMIDDDAQDLLAQEVLPID